MRLNPKASQLSRVCNSMVAVCERPEQHLGRSAVSHLRLDSFLSTTVPRFVKRVACLVSDEVAANRARLTDVVASAFDSLEMDLQFIAELLCAPERGG